MPAAAKNLEELLENGDDEDSDELERHLELLKRYQELHQIAQSDVAAEANFEKLARYETHLDRKFERTLTILLRMQEFRARSTDAGQE